MDNFNTSSFDIYKDISARTKGEIYLGVIGAVRTGKSTFIKRFMEQMVLPYMNDEHDRHECGSRRYGRGSGTVVRMGSRAWEFQ